MKKVTMVLAILFATLATGTLADDAGLENRVKALEGNMPNLPAGLYVNGEIEGIYDDKTYDSGWDSRAELQVGISQDLDIDKNMLNLNWVGATMTYDSDYALDSTLDNTIVEKQLGFGNNFATIYVGETDAQRIGFAKTSKIGAPIIITESSSRLDHNEKTVLVLGGFEKETEFEFDAYRLKREKPWGVVVGYDNNEDSLYASATVSLLGLADVSYMIIDTTAAGSASYTTDTRQEGYAIGGTLRRWDIPMQWGVELWDDKDTGLASDDRIDMGVMYNVTPSTYVTAHRTMNDDLGYDGNYYGVVHNVYANYDAGKRADKQDGLEIGLYLHDKSGTSTITGADYADTQAILGSVKYKF
ncbi:hypothetical protein OAR23_00425 [bacterium]|nr:hypothetical protein [bacterium]